MNLIPEALAVALEAKLVLTPGSIAMLVALGVAAWIVVKWAKRKI